MKKLSATPLSMLDLVPVRAGRSVAEALQVAVQTAQHAEQLGFQRYWLAEHHNMPGIASSATAVLVGHIAGQTQRIRVGSGGVMLPNHAPLVVAEAFGTLAELYPNRIDLGLGRAPGTDGITMRALRRDRPETADDFPREVTELLGYLGAPQPGQKVVATPGANTHVPVWLLGSSLFSAQLAAQRGLPYAFASHFAPQMLLQALEVYRSTFVPSRWLQKPYAIVAAHVVAAPTDAEAELLASSLYRRVMGILTGKRGLLEAPSEGFLAQLQPQELAALQQFLACAAVGSPETVQHKLNQLLQATEADELMLVCDVYEPALRLRSLSLVNQACGRTAPLTAA